MKKIRRDNGWDEVTTKCITIEHIWRNFQTNIDWRCVYEDGGRMSSKGRNVCKCCGSNWAKNNSDVALAFTNKGNKIICQTCTDDFERYGIKVVVNKKDEGKSE